ncbi:semaphorin-7A [Pygocentrus nattereri]|uniref:Sema domain-containing protein n=1 Tax=Pygocentrus nattereri TaxID=42514 RepID=A0A3B4C7T4_PYGNA|nr:semaphorin-7A [Pygocentrus nattereri]
MRLIWQYFLLLSAFLLSVLCSREVPRLTLRQGTSDHRLPYQRNFNHSVFFLHEETQTLFIGGLNCVLQVNLNDSHVLENITLIADRDQSCDKCSCEYAVTVIEEFQDSILVCGTNGEHPKCWKLHPRDSNHSSEIEEYMDGTGISPHTSSQNSVSLAVDGDLYAAAPLYREGTSLQFRRKVGSQTSVWMYDSWIMEPTFISAFLARRPEDPMHEKIYVLFREKNSDSSPEADPWISRVARVCKVDKGGSKSFFQNIWTSFLKARLVCGIPGESLYFNRLQDVFVLHSKDWRDSQVYALFSSSWNSTAVCKYSLFELDAIFENSTFKDYEEEIPSPRPGTCVKDSRSLPTATINVIKNHPEMTDWVRPIQKDSPFYISNNNYTRIVVDRVQAADEKMYNVLLLATDSGMIHKILEDGSKAFIISETRLCSSSASVQTMKLNSEKRKLFVGYPGQMSVLDLQKCQDYNASCQDCVLARDPYCAWTENGCTSQTKGGTQNIATGETHICHNNAGPNKVMRIKRDVSSSSPVPLKIEHTVPMGFPYYLSCPIESHHATYYWMHGNHYSPCQQTLSDCLYLIPAVSEADYGEYTCESRERDYTKKVKKYNLRDPELHTRSSALKITAQKESVLTVSSAVLFIVHNLI